MRTAVTAHPRGRALRRAIFLVAAFGAFLSLAAVQRAGAQGILPRMPILALTYTASSGSSQLLITPGGPDASVGGIEITAVLEQGGRRLSGGGFAHELGNDAFIIAFTLTSADGLPLFLSGELHREANHWTGHGRARFVSDPTSFDTWSAVGGPFSGPRIGGLLPVGLNLNPFAEDGPRGAAVLIPLLEGETRIDLDLSNAVPGATYTAALHGGTCEQPSASFTALPALSANEDGTASASGLVRFRDTENIALVDLVDGERVIIISDENGPVACGAIPAIKLPEAQAQPEPEPDTAE